MNPDDRIPLIRARFDLEALVVRLGGVEAKRSGGTTTFHCPHPGHPDSTPSFTVKAGRWKCWSVCDRSGDEIDLLVWLTGCSKAEAIDQLAAEVGLDRRPPAPPPPPSLVTWCESRGWGPWVIEVLGLTVVADGYGRPRVRFPYRLKGQVEYHQDRAVDPNVKLRWLSPKGSKPIPYEADRMCLAYDRGAVVIVEGVTDVAALVDVYTSPAVVGIPGVQSWRRDWAEAFRGLDVVLIADNDPAGGKLRTKVSDDLAGIARVVWNVEIPQPHNDVAAWRYDLDAEEFDGQLMSALDEVGAAGLLVAG